MRKEPMKLGEFLYLIPEEQNVRIIFAVSELMVEGTQDSISCFANAEVNNMIVYNVEAENSILKVWLKDENA